MNHRPFPALNRDVSEIGLGCWQLDGSSFGPVSGDEAATILDAAHDGGVTFYDTADVYGGGESERRLRRFLRGKSGLTVATKLGRRGDKDAVRPEQLAGWTDESLRNLGVDCIDLTQLHCVGADVLSDGGVLEALRDLRSAGKIRAFGASVESDAQADLCLEQDGLASLQIIFNALRQKPADGLLQRCADRGVAVIVRLPLASGLLAGKFTADQTFAKTDHRSYNADGAAFNVGETFAGLGLARGVEAAGALAEALDGPGTMAQGALRWVLDHPQVTTVIAGATKPEQAHANAAASDLPPLSPHQHDEARATYATMAEPHIRGPY